MTDEERRARLHHHMYETCEGIREHAERIVKLEELVADFAEACGCDPLCPWVRDDWGCRLRERAVGLGVDA